jgi:DsbC/DsbD-like thiol-disulfide interchange protein
MGRFLMHENAMDVCIEVVDSLELKPGVLTWKVYWWNLGYSGTPFKITLNLDTIEIKASNRHRWKYIEDKMYTPRTKPGLP